MKVIFIEDVPGVARVGQSKTVANGYARNYLLPYNLAVVEGSQAAKAADKDMKRKMQQRELEAAELSTLAEKIEGAEITIEAKVGDNDRLYGSVTSADIAEELAKIAEHDIDKKKVDLVEPIRVVGSYDVPVKFMWDLVATVKVHVKSDAPVVVEEKKAPKAEAVAAEAEAETETEAEAPAEGEPEAAAEAEPVAEAAEEPAAEAAVDMPAIDEAVEDLAEEVEAELEEK